MYTLSPFLRLSEKYPGDQCGPFILALSGGADSLLALRLACEAGLKDRLMPVHFHHGLQDEADRATALCEKVCTDLGLELHIRDLPVKDFAKARGMSLEMAGHHLRRRALDELGEKHGACAVITGHQEDDLVETLLLRMSRGTAPAGWPGHSGAGLPREMPLKTFSRTAVRDLARELNLEFWEDPTNSDPKQPRAALRQGLMAGLSGEQRRGFSRAAGLMRAEEQEYRDWFKTLIEEQGPSRILPMASLADLPVPLTRRLLSWLATWARREESPSAGVLERLLQETGRRGSTESRALDLGGGITAWREGDTLRFMNPAGYRPRTLGDLEQGPTALELPDGRRLTVSILSGTARGAEQPLLALPEEDLHWRTWQEGDRLQVASSSRGKKLQDLFTDLKVPRALRGLWPVLSTAEGKALWLPGLAADQPLARAIRENPERRGLWQEGP